MAIFVAHEENNALVGFLEVAIRSHDDGCSPTRPVGFVEGWFVPEAFRKQGIGRKLMCAAEDWARSQDCAEMGSDALIENQGSQGAHKHSVSRSWTAVCIFAKVSNRVLIRTFFCRPNRKPPSALFPGTTRKFMIVPT